MQSDYFPKTSPFSPHKSFRSTKSNRDGWRARVPLRDERIRQILTRGYVHGPQIFREHVRAVSLPPRENRVVRVQHANTHVTSLLANFRNALQPPRRKCSVVPRALITRLDKRAGNRRIEESKIWRYEAFLDLCISQSTCWNRSILFFFLFILPSCMPYRSRVETIELGKFCETRDTDLPNLSWGQLILSVWCITFLGLLF